MKNIINLAEDLVNIRLIKEPIISKCSAHAAIFFHNLKGVRDLQQCHQEGWF